MPDESPQSSLQPGSGMGPHARLFREKVKLASPGLTARRLAGYLKRRKAILVLVFICATASTLVTIFGTRVSGYAVDDSIKTGDLSSLATVCGILVGMYALASLATFIQNSLMIRLAQRTAGELRQELFEALQELQLRFFDSHSSGDLMSRLSNDVDNINLLLAQGVVQLFSGMVMLVGMLIAMLLLSPVLSVIGVALVPVMILGPRAIARLSQASFSAQQKELGNLNGFVEEAVSGRKTLTLYGQEGRSLEDFSAINERYMKSAARAQGLSGTMGPINNAVNNLTYMVISVCGALLILGKSNLSVGVVFAFLLYMRNFTRPINDILNLFSVAQSALAGAERVFEVIDEDKEKDETGAMALTAIRGRVEMEDLHFSYIPGKPILRGVDISAQAGQTVAIVGPTGAGKTTIMNLLPKFYNIDAGSIKIDGTDLRSIQRGSLRKEVSLVLQDPFLFSLTVRDNIRYGRLAASDDEVQEAARKARAHEFILQLPDGYETKLSDNGGNLSQGQRQLLSIARAMLARSSILILDEATSSIDTRTELLIQSALLELMKGKTSFVIAHRLSTIRHADCIIVIDNGQVIESGVHEELLARGGFYAGLYNSQFASGMAL